MPFLDGRLLEVDKQPKKRVKQSRVRTHGFPAGRNIVPYSHFSKYPRVRTLNFKNLLAEICHFAILIPEDSEPYPSKTEQVLIRKS